MKMMKKITGILLCLAVIAACFAGCAATTDEKLEYEIVDNTVKITGYTDATTRTEITVPDEIEGKPVTEIADFSIFNAESLEKITIGKNVTAIGEWSMTNNQRLKEFAVDEANEAFCSVDGVLYTKDMKTLVYFPPAKGIKFNKFGEAQNSTQYVIADGVETIHTKAFYKCYYVEKIAIPDSVKRIEEKAFHRTSALKELKLPAGLEYIGKDAFAYCELIENVTVPAGVTEIEEYAFFNCKGMKTVTMMPKKDSLKLGKNWYPTSNGKQIKECEIIWR